MLRPGEPGDKSVSQGRGEVLGQTRRSRGEVLGQTRHLGASKGRSWEKNKKNLRGESREKSFPGRNLGSSSAKSRVNTGTSALSPPSSRDSPAMELGTGGQIWPGESGEKQLLLVSLSSILVLWV